MRIIGGQARGRTLRAPRGRATRPTSDRVREALFSILQARLGDLTGLEVLDLFSGSGALGLEAVSRGAAEAVLVEAEAACCRIIQQNAAALGLEERCRVLHMQVLGALQMLARQARSFSLILADPPYAEDPAPLLETLAGCDLLRPEGLLVLEHASRSDPLPSPGRLHLELRRVHGDTALSFLSTREENPEQPLGKPPPGR